MIKKSLCILGMLSLLSLTNCVKDTTEQLGDLKGLAGQYGDVTALVRNITNNSAKIQEFRMNNSNLVNSLNQLLSQLSFIPDWNQGQKIFRNLNTVINTLASPPGGVNIPLIERYPTVDTVRAQIAVIKAFMQGWEKYFETLPQNQQDDLNARIQQANNSLASITTFGNNNLSGAANNGAGAILAR